MSMQLQSVRGMCSIELFLSLQGRGFEISAHSPMHRLALALCFAKCVATFRRELTVDRLSKEKNEALYSGPGHTSSNRLAML